MDEQSRTDGQGLPSEPWTDDAPDAPTADTPRAEQQTSEPPPPRVEAARTFSAPPPPPPPAPVRRFSWSAFLGGTLFGCGCLSWILPLLFFTVLAGALSSVSSLSSRGESVPSDSVGLINVDGIITSGKPDGSLFGGSGAEAQRIIRQLKAARANKRIKAVVLYINSPGGSAAGSDAIYEEVLKLRQADIPVIAAMGDMAASGGYYVAAAADRIYANGATLTGSIGVISQLPNFSDPNGWIGRSGYDVEVFKSGRYKDMGNPFRPIPPDERALFQQMVDDIYGQFLAAVSKGRNIPIATLRPLADGRIYTGRQAIKHRLVDQIGTLQDAIAYANKKAGLPEDAEPYRFRDNPLTELLGTPSLLAPNFGGGARSPLGLMLLDPRAREMAKSLTSEPAAVEYR